MLNGGIPRNRPVLLAGGPGVGKSTLAMQFLQEGLEQGDECLYVSTEQTNDELRASFEPFEFDLDHEHLSITTLHATPDSTIESSESGLALETLGDDEESASGPYTFPFEGEYILDHLESYGPCDRVVLDSTSGLAAVSDDQETFRRVVLDLIRLFTDTFEATAIFTAEEVSADTGRDIGSSELLQFTTHGVIRLWWGEVRGSRHRFLHIVKMRGVNHDTRDYEIGFSPSGIHLMPAGRTAEAGFPAESVISTGLDGLDQLSGGLARGHSILLEYDGSAMVNPLAMSLIHAALDEGMCIWLINSPVLRLERFDQLLDDRWDLESLLDGNRLFVLDVFGAWKGQYDHRNVFHPPSGVLGVMFRRSRTVSFQLEKAMASRINDRRDAPMLGVSFTEALLRWLDPQDVKESYYWSRERLARDYDTGFFIHNPETIPGNLAEFYHSDAIQAFEATMDEHGIQYLHVNKSPVGEPGSTGVIDYTPDGLRISMGKSQ